MVGKRSQGTLMVDKHSQSVDGRTDSNSGNSGDSKEDNTTVIVVVVVVGLFVFGIIVACCCYVRRLKDNSMKTYQQRSEASVERKTIEGATTGTVNDDYQTSTLDNWRLLR